MAFAADSEVVPLSRYDYKAAEEFYSTLSMRELRRYQAITQAQIPLAHNKGLTETLEHLQKVDALVTAAIYRKAFL